MTADGETVWVGVKVHQYESGNIEGVFVDREASVEWLCEAVSEGYNDVNELKPADVVDEGDLERVSRGLVRYEVEGTTYFAKEFEVQETP